MKKNMIYTTAAIIILLLLGAFLYLRYLTYKSPSTNMQGKTNPLEKKIFDTIDWARGEK